MLKVELNGQKGIIKIEGTIDEVTSDCIIVIHEIYKELCEKNEDVGEVFRETLTDMVDNGFAFTAEEDDGDEGEDEDAQEGSSVDDIVDDILEDLEELLNQLTKGDKE